jgi:hypothetical protein
MNRGKVGAVMGRKFLESRPETYTRRERHGVRIMPSLRKKCCTLIAVPVVGMVDVLARRLMIRVA